MSRYLTVFLASAGMFVALAHAQGGASATSHREWEFAVFGGGSFLGDYSFPTPVTGSSQATSRTVGLEYATGSLLGLRVTQNKGDRWGAALEYGFSNQPVTFKNLGPSIPSLSLGQSVHRFHYDFLYYPFNRKRRLRPFVMAGSGVSLFYLSEASRSAAAAQGVELGNPWKFSFSWGGGVKYLLWDQVALSFQYTGMTSGIPSYGLPSTGRYAGDNYIPGMQPNGLMNSSLISLGVAYQWGTK